MVLALNSTEVWSQSTALRLSFCGTAVAAGAAVVAAALLSVAAGAALSAAGAGLGRSAAIAGTAAPASSTAATVVRMLEALIVSLHHCWPGRHIRRDRLRLGRTFPPNVTACKQRCQRLTARRSPSYRGMTPRNSTRLADKLGVIPAKAGIQCSIHPARMSLADGVSPETAYRSGARRAGSRLP